VRPPVREVLDLLLAGSAPGAELTLDAVGDALGDRPVTPDEIGWLLDELEAAGRRVGDAPRASAVAALGDVLASARALRQELGRPARVDELSARSGLSEGEVRRALLFARVMSR
jgi:uncharacterized protein YidB (DUF937 family)